MFLVFRIFIWLGFLISLMVFVNGVRLMLEFGVRWIWWIERLNCLVKLVSRLKLLFVFVMNICGRYMVSIWLMRLVRDVDLLDLVGLKMKLWVFICWFSLLNGLKVNGVLLWLNSVKLGCLVLVVCFQMGDRLVMCCVNIIWVYYFRVCFLFGLKLQGSQCRQLFSGFILFCGLIGIRLVLSSMLFRVMQCFFNWVWLWLCMNRVIEL